MSPPYSYIKDLLDSGHSKAITSYVVDYVGAQPDRFDALMRLFFSEDWLMNQRAAWPIPFIVKKYPFLIEPYLERLISNLEKPCHNAVVRNTIRMFEEIDLPEELQGRFYQIGLKLMMDIKEPVANKVFSMTAMYKIAEPHPELLRELKLIIETQMPFEKPGYKSRGRKTLALIDKKLTKDSH
jgi:hypothetical protein